MKQASFFLAGTDTDAGKTVIAAGLLNKLKQAGYSTLGLKPIAAGCESTEAGLRNSDALALQRESTVEPDYDSVNPIQLQPPIAPHIALANINRHVNAKQVVGFIQGAKTIFRPHVSIVEGAGGWLVPLNSRETLATVANQLQFPVILVVGMKLGCINHALLTQHAIQSTGLKIAGWVANLIDSEMLEYEANLLTLKEQLNSPCIGVVPNLEDPIPENIASFLDVVHLDLPEI